MQTRLSVGAATTAFAFLVFFATLFFVLFTLNDRKRKRQLHLSWINGYVLI